MYDLMVAAIPLRFWLNDEMGFRYKFTGVVGAGAWSVVVHVKVFDDKNKPLMVEKTLCLKLTPQEYAQYPVDKILHEGEHARARAQALQHGAGGNKLLTDMEAEAATAFGELEVGPKVYQHFNHEFDPEKNEEMLKFINTEYESDITKRSNVYSCILMDYLKPDGDWVNHKEAICGLIQTLHFNGWIHGDIHMGNIIIYGGRPYILDTGFSQRVTTKDGEPMYQDLVTNYAITKRFKTYGNYLADQDINPRTSEPQVCTAASWACEAANGGKEELGCVQYGDKWVSAPNTSYGE